MTGTETHPDHHPQSQSSVPGTSATPRLPELMLRRVFQAPRERVFKAWTEPEALQAWFGPDEFCTTEAEVDLQVGGRYLFKMELADGTLVEHGGVYREIVPPERLVFTWELGGELGGESGGAYCAGADAPVETLVTVTFVARGAATEVVLRHEKLPSETVREGHRKGWTGCFDSFAAHLAAPRGGAA